MDDNAFFQNNDSIAKIEFESLRKTTYEGGISVVTRPVHLLVTLFRTAHKVLQKVFESSRKASHALLLLRPIK